jgi:hypothetical protein
VTENGAPARAATVVLFPADYRGWITAGMPQARARLITANGTGAYTLPGLRPGEYLAAAVEDAEAGELQDAAFIQALAPVATRVVVVAGDNTLALRVVKVPR